MSGLAASLSLYLWRRPITLLAWLSAATGLGFFARLSYHNFLYLQAQNISQLSVFNELVMPLAGLTLFFQLILVIVTAVQLLPTFHSLQQNSLLEQASIHPARLLGQLLTPVFVAGLWPLVYFMAIVLCIATKSPLDPGRLSLTIGGLLIINLISSCLVFAITTLCQRILSGLILSILLVGIILIVESSLWFWWPGNHWQGIFNPFFRFREGVLMYADLASSLAWIVIGYSSCYLLLNRKRLVKRSYLYSCLAAGIVVAMTAGQIDGQMDLTANQRNTFSQSIDNLLAERKGELRVIAVIEQETGRDEIRRGFEIVQRGYPNSHLSFQSRQSLAPEFQHQGEYLHIQLGELQQTVAYPFDMPAKVVFELAIEQMLRRKTQWITFIEGHGEASPFGKTTSDLGQFYRVLTEMGWPVAVQNLSQQPLISDNTQLMIIASSKQSWLDNEVQLVVNYLKKGGNLLLLLDPDSNLPLPIEEYIGISRFSGTLVDWSGYQSGTPHPAIIIVNQFTAHPVVNQLASLLAFPWTSGLKKTPDSTSKLHIEPIILSHTGVWNESNISGEQLIFEPQEGETQQAFVIAMAAENAANQQKIAVVGDSHFVSDSAINNYANQQFALNLVSWLSNIAPYHPAQANAGGDSYIQPSRSLHFILNWGFSALIPLLLLGVWGMFRYRRSFRRG